MHTSRKPLTVNLNHPLSHTPASRRTFRNEEGRGWLRGVGLHLPLKMVCGTSCGTKSLCLWDKAKWVMKKYPRYGIRVSEELDEVLRRVGPERVREVLQEAFLGKKDAGVPSWSKGKLEDAEEKPEPPQTTGMDVLRAIASGPE